MSKPRKRPSCAPAAPVGPAGVERHADYTKAMDRARSLAYQYQVKVLVLALAQPFGLYLFPGPHKEFPSYLRKCVVAGVALPV